MRNLLRLILMALVLLIVALVSALTAMRLAIHGREVAVPDLRSKTPAEAHRMADDAGLSMQIESNYYSATIPEGKVLSQVPAAGTVVRRGWEVRVALSLGPQRVAIPQVVGDSERAAGITIAQRALEIASTARVTIPGTDADQVMAQNPPANATDVSAPKVSLLVTQQSPPQAFVMPPFTGQLLGSVTMTLRNAGFRVGNVTVIPPDVPASGSSPVLSNSAPAPETNSLAQSAAPLIASPASIIVSQDPAAGAKVLAGSAIDFVVR